jgi:hypothetical protein
MSDSLKGGSNGHFPDGEPRRWGGRKDLHLQIRIRDPPGVCIGVCTRSCAHALTHRGKVCTRSDAKVCRRRGGRKVCSKLRSRTMMSQRRMAVKTGVSVRTTSRISQSRQMGWAPPLQVLPKQQDHSVDANPDHIVVTPHGPRQSPSPAFCCPSTPHRPSSPQHSRPRARQFPTSRTTRRLISSLISPTLPDFSGEMPLQPILTASSSETARRSWSPPAPAEKSLKKLFGTPARTIASDSHPVASCVHRSI